MLAGWAGWLLSWLAGWLVAGWAGWLAGWMADIRFHRFSLISCVFRGFHEISWISRVRGQTPCGPLCCRGPSPIETFARSQVAAGCWLLFHRFSWISCVFRGFHEISWISRVRGQTSCGSLWPPVATRSVPYRNLCSMSVCCYFIDFHDFHGFP